MKMLVLKKHSGDLDVPKGCTEEGETPFESAVRECFEESGLSDLDFVWGTKSFFVGGTTTLFVAQTASVPVITPNPVTDELEHLGYKWVDVRTAPSLFGGHWLEPAVEWACSVVVGEAI